MITTKLILAASALLLSSSLFASSMYRWVDDNGVTHFGERPPAGTQAEEMRSYAPASSSQDDAIEKLEQRREQNRQQKAREQQKSSGDDDIARYAEAKKQACDQHRENLETLNNTHKIRRLNEATGEQEVLTPEQRKQLVQETQQALEGC